MDAEATSSRVKPTLYLMCGLPFAGKTVIATRLASLGAEMVSIDEIKTAHGLRDVWEGMQPEDWVRIFAEARSRVSTALDEHRGVVYDSTNHTKQSREEWRDLAEAHGADFTIVFVDVSPDEARRRWIENKDSQGRMDLSTWAFERALADYEPPTGEPGVMDAADLTI